MAAYLSNVDLRKTTYIRGVGNLRQWMAQRPISDEDAQRRLDNGDNEKIDGKLDDLGVSKISTGKDQTSKLDTGGCQFVK